jgi:hypothetical protein
MNDTETTNTSAYCGELSESLQTKLHELYHFKESKWQFKLSKGDCVVFNVAEAPNWFHRLMQRFVLGVVWKKIKS